MAVIEEEPSADKNFKPQPRPVVPPQSSEYNSDGYETASDTELNEDISGSENHSGNLKNDASKVDTVGKGDEVIHGVKEKERQQESESSEAERNERALFEANDAKIEGNTFFNSGSYEEALSKYELSIQIAPNGPSSAEIRSICYANRAACFSKLGN